MKIKGIVLSSIIITNILTANPNPIEEESRWVGSGEVLMAMLNHPDVTVNMFGNVYIRGVASGLIYDSYIIDWMDNYNSYFSGKIQSKKFLQLPQPVDWREVTNEVYKYLLRNPKSLELPSIILIEDALHQAYGGINN
tara:strand:- start:87 stop:500 length:414 start_codon:yes stop_codon:yes gene_type:complete